MNVQVRFFASLAELADTVSDSVELAEGADVGVLWKELLRRYPALVSIGFKPLIACDMEYSTWETALEGVEEVAFLPPLSGG